MLKQLNDHKRNDKDIIAMFICGIELIENGYYIYFQEYFHT